MATSLSRKLQLRPGQKVSVRNPPPGYLDELRPAAAGAELVEDGPGLDFVQLFARDAAELDRLAPSAVAAVKPDGLLWICYPKGGKKAGTDLSRDLLWELMSKLGLAGVTLVAIDGTWSAMRFRPADRVGS